MTPVMKNPKPTKTGWLAIDAEGLGQLRKGDDVSFVPFELIQNAFDADGVTEVRVSVSVREDGKVDLVVVDDSPVGFVDLAHAYTVFARSNRRDKADKRGRYNLGEKLALTVCDEASIATTSGTILFLPDGSRREDLGAKRERGTQVTLTMALGDRQYAQLGEAVQRVIQPDGVELYVGAGRKARRTPTRTIDATLPTVIGEDMRPSERKTRVEIYRLRDNERGWLYEMGIPIVQHGDPWDYNVMQKVPVTLDRTNVKDSRFMRRLSLAIVNGASELITEATAHEGWVTRGVAEPDAGAQAVAALVVSRFGENAMIADPSDPEANHRAVAAGVSLVTGGHLPGAVWAHVKDYGLLQPTTVDYKTKHPHEGDANFGEPEKELREETLTDGMRAFRAWFLEFAAEVVGSPVRLRFVSNPKEPFSAWHQRSSSTTTFNVFRLSKAWFEPANLERWIDLSVHELGHQYAGNHLSDEYFRALTKLAAKATLLALRHPELFEVSGAAVKGG